MRIDRIWICGPPPRGWPKPCAAQHRVWQLVSSKADRGRRLRAPQPPETANLPLPHTLTAYVSGFNVSWEADFWGRYRRLMSRRDAQWARPAKRQRRAGAVGFGGGVQLRATAHLEQRIENAESEIAIQRGSLQLAEDRFGQGVASELDMRRTRWNRPRPEATVHRRWRPGARQAANQLCILLSMPVLDLARQLGPAPIPRPPLAVAVGVPADLIRRRPDAQAERLVRPNARRSAWPRPLIIPVSR